MRGTFLYLTDEWPISRDALRALGAVEAVVRSGSSSPPTYSVRLPDGRLSLETLTDDEAGQHVSQVAAWIASAEEGAPTQELLSQLAEFERVLLIEGTAKGGDESGLRRFLTRLATLRDGRILHGNALYDLDGACLFGEDTAPDWFADEPGGDPEAESYARRQATLAVLAREGFPTADSAVRPRLEAHTWLRPLDAVVRRASCLALVAELAVGGDAVLVRARAERMGLLDDFTPTERAFLDDPALETDLSAALSWRYESANALLWALGWVDDLPPDDHSDPDLELRLASHSGPEALAHEADLRPVSTILDQLDLVQMRLQALGEEPPPDPDTGGPAAERYDRETLWEHLHALEWLTLTVDLDWDMLDEWDGGERPASS